TKPRQLAKALELDDSSAWRFWQVAYAYSEREAMLHLSSETATDRFLQALAAKGVNTEVCDHARHVLRDFVRLVDEQIGDVGTLKLMVERASRSAFAGDRYAKTLYDAMRYRVGAFGRTAMWISARVPNPSFDGLLDTLTLRAMQGIRTLEDQRTYQLHATYSFDRDDDSGQWKKREQTIEPLGEPDLNESLPEGATPVPMLPEASRMNGRAVWTSTGGRARGNEVCMSGGRAGALGESSFAFGERYVADYATYNPTSEVGIGVGQNIPYENMVFEFYVSDEQVQAGLRPRAQIYDYAYGDLSCPGTLIRDNAATMEHYRPGRPRGAPDTVEYYQELQAAVEAAMRCSLADLHLFRWRVKYPAVGVYYTMYSKGSGGE
ncbi:MAG TPA: hypothetical protein VG963_30005, partial [Polyangiaceae bacterium]|nr:hypothetical protein [Polyangiaceae bacterium]